MRPGRWLGRIAATAVAPLIMTLVGPAMPVPAGPAPLAAEPLLPDERIESIEAPTSRLAQTDPELLGRTDPGQVPVLVKLDHDPVATYAGGVSGYDATSPAVTGAGLTGNAAARAYESYLRNREDRFATALADVAPEAVIRQRLRTVYGGVAATVPANTLEDVLAIDGVTAVQQDQERELLTDASPDFIGAPAWYPQAGGAADAGRGTIVGILDTGGWPEHPSFADQGNLDPPPGPARECAFGPDPSTADDTPFECNNKLIGGQAFLDTYTEERGDQPFPGTARDGHGHGTHVASTAAGNVLESAPVLGAEHGPIAGVAPGAWVMHYRVCGVDSCFVSDSAAAIEQAIRDGVDVLNFSIGGGTEPFLDPVSLAFLDAYAAGIFPAASAGNSGPAAGTVNHVAPWVTSVAATTQTREFGATLHLTASDGATASFDGVSITGGVADELPVVLAGDPPYGDPLCEQPAPEDTFQEMIVVCERGGVARTLKGYQVAQGGAAGMILYNPELADTTADTHWLPAIQLAEGADLLAFLADHDGVVGSFTGGAKRDGQADVVAAFSSRGPGSHVLKPDLTAPGVQILAGDIPIEGDPAAGGGPAGELFQAIGGTSMAAPHVAGAALLLRARQPDWTPGQLQSVLLTTANPDLVAEDLTTPAGPFDRGSGRVDLAAAENAGLTLDETATHLAALGGNPLTAVHLNLPSVNVPVMPGRVSTVRTVTNVTADELQYEVDLDLPDRGGLQARPERFTLAPGASQELQIQITGAATGEQQFGTVQLVPQADDRPVQRIPVAFRPQLPGVLLDSTCDPAELSWLDQASCTVTATNESTSDATVQLTTRTDPHLLVVGTDGAERLGLATVRRDEATLPGTTPARPSLASGRNPAGEWVSLAALGIAAHPVAADSILNFSVPSFRYGDETYDRIGVTTNGYAVAGGGVGADVVATPPGLPDPARPNNVLAPFWSDLDGRGAPGIRAATVTVGDGSYLVFEWDVYPAGSPDRQQFQLWLGSDGVEDITFGYNPAALPDSPNQVAVGAENSTGTGGDTLGLGVLPTGDLEVTSGGAAPGGSVTYRLDVRGMSTGPGTVTTTMVGDSLPGETMVTVDLPVRPRDWFETTSQ